MNSFKFDKEWETVVKDGNLEILKALDTVKPDSYDSNLTILASKFGNTQILEWLKEEKNAKFGTWDLLLACRNGRLETIKYLVKNIEEYSGKNGNSAIDWAAEKGHLDVIVWLYENGFNKHTSDGLYSAMKNEHVDVVNWYLEHQENNNRKSLQIKAIEQGEFSILKWLKENYDEFYGFENSHFLWAIFYNHYNIVDFMVDCSVDKFNINFGIKLAELRGNVQMVQKLREYL